MRASTVRFLAGLSWQTLSKIALEMFADAHEVDTHFDNGLISYNEYKTHLRQFNEMIKAINAVR